MSEQIEPDRLLLQGAAIRSVRIEYPRQTQNGSKADIQLLLKVVVKEARRSGRA
jgi:hypothetical protein